MKCEYGRPKKLKKRSKKKRGGTQFPTFDESNSKEKARTKRAASNPDTDESIAQHLRNSKRGGSEGIRRFPGRT